MDDLERAIVCTINPEVPPQLKAQALQYLNEARALPDTWKTVVMKIFEARDDRVRFFCLQLIQDLFALNRYSKLSEQDQLDLRRALLQFLSDRLCNPNENAENFLKNKFAQILVLLFKEEYPHRWPTFFDDLLSSVVRDQSGLIIDMFLRIMESIDEEVASMDYVRSSEDQQRNANIKDHMRVNSIQKIVDVWHHILVSCQQSKPRLVVMALDNLKRYVAWIDINLIANDRMLNVFFNLLHSDELGESVIDLFNEGMSPRDKVALMHTLKLSNLLAAVKVEDDDSKVDFYIKCAKLVNTMGVEAATAVLSITDQQVNGAAQQLLSDARGHLFQFLQHPDDEVSESVLAFATQYLHLIKSATRERGGQVSDEDSAELRRFLEIIAFKCRFDENFDFNRKDENEELFLRFRKSLASLFKLITQLSPTMVASIVHEQTNSLRNLKNPQEEHAVFQIEVALWMFYKMGEGLSEEVLQQTKDFFANTVDTLNELNVAMHPHAAVSTMYFNIVNRYARFLAGRTATIRAALTAMLDERGLRNSRPAIRIKCADLLVRVCRTLRNDLCQLVPEILTRVSDLISFTSSDASANVLQEEDKLNIYEALGVLAGSANTSMQASVLEALRGYTTEPLRTLVNAAPWNDEKAMYALCMTLSAVGSFSKGFPHGATRTHDAVRAFFVPTLDLVVTSLRACPKHPVLRSKVEFYLHRMIQCIGVDLFSHIPAIIELLISHAGPAELIEAILVVNQLMHVYKESVSEVIDEMLMPLISHVWQFIQQAIQRGISAKSEEEREIVDVRRHLYILLNTVVQSVPNVLVSQRNGKHFAELLESVVDGCRFYMDVNIQRICVGIFRKMVPQWAATNEAVTKFLYERVVRLTFEVPADKRFNLEDGTTLNVRRSIVLEDLYKKCGQNLVQYLGTVLLPALNLPANFSQAYLQHLTNSTPKDFRGFLRDFFANAQGGS